MIITSFNILQLFKFDNIIIYECNLDLKYETSTCNRKYIFELTINHILFYLQKFHMFLLLHLFSCSRCVYSVKK